MSALQRTARIIIIKQDSLTGRHDGDQVSAEGKAFQLIIVLPCKDAPGTIEIMRRYLNIRLVEGLRITQTGHSHHVPFSFSHEEAARFAEDLNRIGTASQIVSSPLP